jgi:hypothetical protein
LTLVDEAVQTPLGVLDTSARDANGGYCRHIVETVVPPDGARDLARFIQHAA